MDDESVRQISKQLGVNEKDVWDMELRLHGDASLNEVVFDDAETDRQDMLTDGSDTIEEQLAEKQEKALLNKKLAEAIASLSEREQTIVRERFLTDTPTTLETLGERFQISRERVRQIESKAFSKLSAFMHA